MNAKKEAALCLPKQATVSKIDPASLVITIIAPPKWGKTEFAMSHPDCVLLAFEEGHRFQRGHKMIIDRWDAPKRSKYEVKIDADGNPHMTFMQAITALETFSKYRMVIIDTALMAAKMCSDFWCEQEGVEHLSDMGEWGKGYDKGQNNPFRLAMMRILKTGRGVMFLCHTKLEIARFTSGEKARKDMQLPGGIKHFIEAQSDVIMHGELGKKQPGARLRDRVLVTEADNDTLAGNRSDAQLPERYIVKRGAAWTQFARFFSDPNAATLAEKIYRKRTKMKSED